MQLWNSLSFWWAWATVLLIISLNGVDLRIAFEIINFFDPSQVTLHEIKTNENWKILAEKKIFFAKVVIVFARTCKEKYFCKLFISLLLCLLLKKPLEQVM